MSEPTYQLTISSRQARLIIESLDAWCRLQAGQLHPIHNLAPQGCDYGRLEEVLGELRKVLFPQFMHGESSVNYPGGRELFNLRKVIEHCVSWNERPLQPGQFQTVNYDGPLESWWETGFRATMRPQMSKAAQDARKPLPPEALVDALHDKVDVEPGKARAAKTVRRKKDA